MLLHTIYIYVTAKARNWPMRALAYPVPANARIGQLNWPKPEVKFISMLFRTLAGQCAHWPQSTGQSPFSFYSTKYRSRNMYKNYLICKMIIIIVQRWLYYNIKALGIAYYILLYAIEKNCLSLNSWGMCYIILFITILIYYYLAKSGIITLISFIDCIFCKKVYYYHSRDLLCYRYCLILVWFNDNY